MKLHEALASGRSIRRIGEETWYGSDVARRSNWHADEVLADDWEVEPEPPKPLEVWAVVWESIAGSEYVEEIFTYRTVALAKAKDRPHRRVVLLREVADE